MGPIRLGVIFDVLKRGCPSTPTASRAPVGVRVQARVHVRYCSRACALSPLIGTLIGTLSQSYPRFARLVLRSLRSRVRVRPGVCVSLARGRVGVRGCLLSSPSCGGLPSSLSPVLAFFGSALSLSLLLSSDSLSYHSSSALSRSSLLVRTLILRVLARRTLSHSLILRGFVHSSLSYSDILIGFLTLSVT